MDLSKNSLETIARTKLGMVVPFLKTVSGLRVASLTLVSLIVVLVSIIITGTNRAEGLA